MNTRHLTLLAGAVVILSTAATLRLTVSPALAQDGATGESIYAVKCAACHKTGLMGAPKLGVTEDWSQRLAQGRATLVSHAIEGLQKMPPRGGNPGLSDADVASAVGYMLAQLGAGEAPAAVTADTMSAKARKPDSRAVAKPKKVPVRRAATSGVNAFNRLMKPPSKRNPPPSMDGIHDPANPGTDALQSPGDAFSGLPRAPSGNRVDWVAALKDKHINPRHDRMDPNAQPVIMDLNIVREVKGSMPNVVYPHEAHTQWLDCSNCHPEIFLPQKGANQMSMAGILLGKQCGVCHGKVAFPVSDCRRCHSGNKN